MTTPVLAPSPPRPRRSAVRPAADRLGGRARGRAAPHRVDQLVDGRPPSLAQQEGDEDRALLRGPGLHRLAVTRDADRSQH
ncbi:hypothetical protein, partial [Streptomyces sp. PAL114]|uniref:hypothetical protein n=1 Tax=Streptomyces sp. PAL114 TaxID=2970893 RepID=UPI003966F8F5